MPTRAQLEVVRPENNHATNRWILLHVQHLHDRADLDVLNKLSETKQGRRAEHGVEWSETAGTLSQALPIAV